MNPLLRAEYMEKPKEGTNSTKGIGLNFPDPEQGVTFHNGVHVPVGNSTSITYAATVPHAERPVLNYNEFIVYDASQVRMRYMVQFRQKGAKYKPKEDGISQNKPATAMAEDDDDDEEEED